MTESSYRVECEECDRSIPASARYCQFCGVEQQRALRVIERMRSAQGDEIRTDGGQDAQLRGKMVQKPRQHGEADVVGEDKYAIGGNWRINGGPKINGGVTLPLIFPVSTWRHLTRKRGGPNMFGYSDRCEIPEKILLTDGGQPTDDADHIPLWLWWLFVVALCTVFVVILWNAGVVA